MADTKKYFVVVADPKDKLTVHQELSNSECVDPMPHSLHNGIFMLTEEQASTLSNDPRIKAVHLTAAELGLIRSPSGIRLGNFSKLEFTTSTQLNWALPRCISGIENFLGDDHLSEYTYNLNGTDVDVVIFDTGVEPGHPEFAVNEDGSGGSRVVDYDWTQTGVVLQMPVGGFLGDVDGHGTHVASIVAGNKNGWASNANIYSLRVVATETFVPMGPPANGNSIYDNRVLSFVDEFQAWQAVRVFHQNKSVNPETGYKNPTVVIAAYSYLDTYQRNNIINFNYRGTTISESAATGATTGAIRVADGGSGYLPTRYPALDAEVSSTVAAGVIVIGAAGNEYHKIDVVGGDDYNNYWIDDQGYFHYYHRGASPSAADGVICVGASSWALPEHKYSFSNTGPRVDMFAPGGLIVGAYGPSPYIYDSIPDPRNTDYYLNSLIGTTQASAQVGGMVAMLAQLRPWYTCTDVLSWLTNYGPKDRLLESYYQLEGTYTNFSSLQGAVNVFPNMVYNLPYSITFT